MRPMNHLEWTITLTFGALLLVVTLLVRKRLNRPAAVAARPRLTRHEHGITRTATIEAVAPTASGAGERSRTITMRCKQELTALERWHIEVEGPFSRGLTLSGDGDGHKLGDWVVGGPPDAIVAFLTPANRSALTDIPRRFALRAGRLSATLEIFDVGLLASVPADVLGLAECLLATDPSIDHVITTFGDNDPSLRALALDALLGAHRGHPACGEALRAAPTDTDPRVRMRAWLHHNDTDRVRDEIRGASDEAVQAALNHLAVLRLRPEVLAPLWIEAIDARWSGPALCRWLASALGRPEIAATFGGATAAEVALCRLLERGADRSVADAAMTSLERVGTAACIPALRAHEQRDPRAHEVRLRIQNRLGKGGELAVIDNNVVGALSESSPEQ
jgi:hypothetical protein